MVEHPLRVGVAVWSAQSVGVAMRIILGRVLYTFDDVLRDFTFGVLDQVAVPKVFSREGEHLDALEGR